MVNGRSDLYYLYRIFTQYRQNKAFVNYVLVICAFQVRRRFYRVLLEHLYSRNCIGAAEAKKQCFFPAVLY